jgi:hypothetical protein
MISYLPNEEWKTLKGALGLGNQKYAYSNMGRVASYKKTIEEGKILGGSITAGYPAIRVRLEDGSKKLFYVHRLVASGFLQQPSAEHKIVIHLDYEKLNNSSENLKWVTKKEKEVHQMGSPYFLAGIEKRREKKTLKGLKLNAKQVLNIKKLIKDPERKKTFKQIAHDFNISEMQLYRIKSGENWSHIKIGEPIPTH